MSYGKFNSTQVISFGIRVALLMMLAAIASVAVWAQNAVPLINQPLAPESVAPGATGFTLTVHGTGSYPLRRCNGMGVRAPRLL
jgi:hypothetical protein